jgi:ABC-type glycerol-3-phosphate transport system substrate-binding protein
LDEDVLLSVLSFYSDCIETGALSPMTILDIADVDQGWEQFKAGWGEMAVVRASRYWLEADDTVAPAPVPTRDGHPFSIARGWAVAMVTDDPARQEQAKLLLDWLIAPDHSAQWSQAAGYLPGTRSALRQWDISEADKALLRGIMEAAVLPPRPEVMASVGPAMQGALEAVLRRQATPKKAAADALKSLEQ